MILIFEACDCIGRLETLHLLRSTIDRLEKYGVAGNHVMVWDDDHPPQAGEEPYCTRRSRMWEAVLERAEIMDGKDCFLSSMNVPP